MAAVTTMWPLKRYATFHQTTPKEVTSGPSVKGSWQEYYGNESPLKALLHADGQFVLTSGTTIMESINLRSADSWIRGTSKGDSVLIICKMKEETRRFRMQFSESSGQTEVTKCREFAERVSEYFPIKVISTEKRQNNMEKKEKETLEGEITLSKIAKIVTKEDDASFPAAYRKCCNTPSDQLDFALRLCLSDPTFPAFVEEIEQKLNKIKNI
ncbi:meiotic recombination protein REC114-like [Argopecten irradians]|uniref:meiotic recombination protein REC114-like n=1 Tax=Argopecten irradians TaxID=31199 RepID=UPI00371F7D6C